MKYFIQSYIDLITNSSTSVFTLATSTESVKDIINAVLKSANVNITCDDLFIIGTEYDIELSDTDGYYITEARKKLKLEPNKYPDLEKLILDYGSSSSWSDKSSIEEKIYHYMVDNCEAVDLNQYAEEYNASYPERFYSSYYTITSKDPSNTKNAAIIERINSLFDYDANYC